MHGEIVHRRGTKALRQRFASMAGHLSQSDGLDAALAIHLGLYCMAAGCFALGLFLLLQPSRSANPGLAAYKPPPATVMTFAEVSRTAPAEASILMGGSEQAAAAKPETTGMAASAGNEIKKSEPDVKPTSSKRPRAAARKQRRNPMMDYAAQPFGGFRPWY